MIYCQYIANDHEDRSEFSSEKVRDGVVTCTSEAEVVIRPEGMEAIKRPGDPKRVVCRKHAQYLTSDKTERSWEQCGEEESVKRLANASRKPNEGENQ